MRHLLKRLIAPIGVMVIISACSSAPEVSPTASPAPSVAPTPTASPTPTADPTPTTTPGPTPTAEPTGSAPPTAKPGGFGIPSNPTADALFLVRDDCQNPSAGYQLEFPEDWWTNTAIGNVPACSWFSPTFYEVPDPSLVPDEIAIEIFLLQGGRGYLREILSSEEIVVVGTQEAFRLEIDGTADGGSGRTYEYVVQLGPTPEQGPNLIARTDTAMGGTFELNRGVLDRIMATMRFVGTVQ
ncbi:MAG: hypothetical protein ACR2K4_03285 [Candidatus Limnocylindria bacterium]